MVLTRVPLPINLSKHFVTTKQWSMAANLCYCNLDIEFCKTLFRESLLKSTSISIPKVSFITIKNSEQRHSNYNSAISFTSLPYLLLINSASYMCLISHSSSHMTYSHLLSYFCSLRPIICRKISLHNSRDPED